MSDTIWCSVCTKYYLKRDEKCPYCELALKDHDLLLERDRAEKAETENSNLLMANKDNLDWYRQAIERAEKSEAQVKMLVEALQHEQSCRTCAEDGCPSCPDCSAGMLLAKIKEESASSPMPDANTDSQ